jgi:hypothetical protein
VAFILQSQSEESLPSEKQGDNKALGTTLGGAAVFYYREIRKLPQMVFQINNSKISKQIFTTENSVCK